MSPIGYPEGEGRINVEALIEASSLGTPEAKALRESVPDEVGRAIAFAAKCLGERDELAALLENTQALAAEAIAAVGGSHGHWREGGAGGVCRTCEGANQRQAEFRERLDALSADRVAPVRAAIAEAKTETEEGA